MAELKATLSDIADRLESDGCPHMAEVRAVFDAFGDVGGCEPTVIADTDPAGTVDILFTDRKSYLKFVVYGDGDLVASAYALDADGECVSCTKAALGYFEGCNASEIDEVIAFHRTLRAGGGHA